MPFFYTLTLNCVFFVQSVEMKFRKGEVFYNVIKGLSFFFILDLAQAGLFSSR